MCNVWKKIAFTSANIATREFIFNHRAEYICTVVADILEGWEIPLSKFTGAVTENDANIVAVLKKKKIAMFCSY